MQKCAVIGCGNVGATTAFALLKSGLFSDILLLDRDMEKARGEAMDLQHSNPFTRPVDVRAADYPELGDCALIIITAGANQAPGETRLDLVQKNVAIMRSIIPQITAHNKEGILLIVSNPVDILTQAALQISGFEKSRVIGSGTVLDTARLKYLLGRHLQVDARNVHALIMGEHGDTEFPVWSSANISGVDIADFCTGCGRCEGMQEMEGIARQVKESAYEIIEKKGATYYAIALAVLRIAEAIIRDENSVLTVSTPVDGHYGLSGLCLGVPAIVGQKGVKQVLDIPLNQNEQAALLHSAHTLRGTLREAGLS